MLRSMRVGRLLVGPHQNFAMAPYDLYLACGKIIQVLAFKFQAIQTTLLLYAYHTKCIVSSTARLIIKKL